LLTSASLTDILTKIAAWCRHFSLAADLSARWKSDRETKLVTSDLVETLNRDLSEFTKSLQVSRRVLVVDDESTIRIVISEYLATKNILADAVTTGEEGLEHLEKSEYAVLVVDKNLPGMSGMALLKAAKERYPDMEVLVITAYASIESALVAIEAGAFDYIPKPFPSLTYLYDKILGALFRYDFEVRIYAVIAYLIKTCKSLLSSLNDEDQREWVVKLENILASSDQDQRPPMILVYGSKTLARSVEKLGYRTRTAMDLDGAIQITHELEIDVLILSEDGHSLDVAEIVTSFQAKFSDMGVFVIAREGNLDKIVKAIGVGVGDYMVRPLEGRDFFAPRLERLVKRQQRMVRHRRVLQALKGLNIELQTQLPGRMTPF
jgi:DNA-binding response OmpR family regulator